MAKESKIEEARFGEFSSFNAENLDFNARKITKP